MNLYSIDVRVTATAYIKAGSRAEALAKAKGLHGDCLNAGDPTQSEVDISGRKFDDPDLPEVSLSPVMTVWGAIPNTIAIAADNANRKG